ncbi:unnamed protein product [Brugia timori]|uniref:LAM_G_DOMAIN domain-containing protein n=1 Tax=Brugia timori TaxID=42155 RepID=A0A0R3Q4H5_9BILA|nr:unnamed protein product [Brugia timori]
MNDNLSTDLLDEKAGADPNDSLLLDGRNEYALVKKMISKRRSKILTDYQFMIKTNKSEGLIWWESKRHMIRSNYIAIFVLAGRLGFAINLGSSPKVKVIGSNTIVNDNRWHSVALLREKRKSLLIVDNEKITYISPSPTAELMTDGIIWIGKWEKENTAEFSSKNTVQRVFTKLTNLVTTIDNLGIKERFVIYHLLVLINALIKFY